jgi:hypothetical protein
VKPLITTLLIAVTAIAVVARCGATEFRELSGPEAEAVALALKVFKSKQGSKDESGKPVYGDLKHYTIELSRDGDRLEIDFGPEFGPKDKGPDGMTTVGGATQYGWAVTYIVSLKQMKIVDEHYSK